MKILGFIKSRKKLIKFLIVGTTSTFIDVFFLYVFVDLLSLNLYVGVVLAFFLAVVNGFIWNKLWTFRDKSKKYKRQFTKFLFVSIGGLVLTLSSMYLFVQVFSINYIIAKLLTSIFVVIWNFLGNKYWTFKVRQKQIFNEKFFTVDYSIIVPAYNEENRIGKTLDKINKFFNRKNKNFEILVIDDGSLDETVKVVDELEIKNLKIIKNGKNMGKGYSVRNGVKNAIGKYILFTDADNSTPIEEFDSLEKYIKKYEVVIGSRYCKNAKVKIKQGIFRQKIGRIGNKVIAMFLFDGIADTQCGFKLFKSNEAKNIFSKSKINGFGFDMEILLAAKTLSYKIKEVPVSWYNSDFSRVRPIRDTFKTLMELFFIKINFLFDGYK